jgi:hypothetical protein
VTAGAYYGHPDPARGEYVLDDGNPGGTNPYPDAVVAAYPVGTKPAPNYAGYNYDLGLHRSPDGIIEYYGKQVFGGELNTTLLVTEYSGGDDIVALSRDANGNITGATRDIPGLSGFDNPISLAEDNTNGDIYVSEYGAKKLTLLVPVSDSVSSGTISLPIPISPAPTKPMAPTPTTTSGTSKTTGSTAAPSGTSEQAKTGVQAASGTGTTPAEPADSTPTAPAVVSTPTPPVSPAVAAAQAVQSSTSQLTSDESAYKSTIAGYLSALKTATAADESKLRLDRRQLRTDSHNQALQAVVQAQIAADKAKLNNDVAAAKANIKSAKITFTQAIGSDKLRLKAARLNLRHEEKLATQH